MTRRAASLALGVVALSQIGATDCGQVIRDPGFDLWCGARLCAWTVETGTVAPSSTWHDGDLGVALVGDQASITQTAPLTSSDGTCVEFEMVTNIAADAEVHLQMDAFADGVIDYDVRIPTANWAPVSYRVTFASPFQGIQFRLVKTGSGEAVLAEIGAHTVDGCTGAPVALPPRPLGAWCLAPSDCASAICDGVVGLFLPPPTCGACADDGECDPGRVCGTLEDVPNILAPYRGCIAAGSRALGQVCSEGAECSTGVCYGGSCSTCGGDATCPGGGTCARVADTFSVAGGTATWLSAPHTCDPLSAKGAAGVACLADDDCASRHCDAAGGLRVCLGGGDQGFAGDGRTCTGDDDCPENGKHAAAPCVAVGTLGGTCR